MTETAPLNKRSASSASLDSLLSPSSPVRPAAASNSRPAAKRPRIDQDWDPNQPLPDGVHISAGGGRPKASAPGTEFRGITDNGHTTHPIGRSSRLYPAGKEPFASHFPPVSLRPYSRRWPPPTIVPPRPKPILPAFTFRAGPYTGPGYPQPASRSDWQPAFGPIPIPGAEKPKLILPKPHLKKDIPRKERGLFKAMRRKEVKPKPTIYKYAIGDTYRDWTAPRGVSLATFEAYTRDADRFAKPKAPSRILLPTQPRPPGWTSPAQRASEEILENIFGHLHQLVMDTPLPSVPIKGRDPWVGTLTNERLTNGEIKAYKTAVMRKQLFDYGKVCKSWWTGTQKGWNEVVIVGEKDAERATHHIERWIPIGSTKHLSLTLQVSLPFVHRLLRSFVHAVHRLREKERPVPILGLEPADKEESAPDPRTVPVPIHRLTILHSFAPEDLGELELAKMEEVFKLLAPTELEFEFFAGEHVIDRQSLDTVARALRLPWGYFGSEDKFKVVINPEDEMGLFNTSEGGQAMVGLEKMTGERRPRAMNFTSERGRRWGSVKQAPRGQMTFGTVGTGEHQHGRPTKAKAVDSAVAQPVHSKKKAKLDGAMSADGEEEAVNGPSAAGSRSPTGSSQPLTTSEPLNVSMQPALGTTYQPQASAALKRKRDVEEIGDEEEIACNDATTGGEAGEDKEGDEDKADFEETGLNEDSMPVQIPLHHSNASPWFLKDDPFEPTTNPEDRIAGFIYLLERRYMHLDHKSLELLAPDERRRREIWAELFGENDDLKREFSLADKRWLQIADRNRMPKGWIPPLGWKIGDKLGPDVLSCMMEAWMGCMKVLSIRGHWMNLYLRSAKKGKLEEFHYHFVPLGAKTVKRATHRRKPHRSPNPPLGSLKSLDNILMWDFRERPEKWYRKMERKKARERGEVWVEPPPTRTLKWATHVPFELWMQQKDRARFKGKGRLHPWMAENQQVVVDAIGKVLLAEGERWDVPACAEDEDWDDRRYFNEMINFVTERQTRRKGPVYPLCAPIKTMEVPAADIRMDGSWAQHHIDRMNDLLRIERNKWLGREERWFNDPDPVGRRMRWAKLYMEHYLEQQGPEGRRALMLKLRKKHGAKQLWQRCHWDLHHPDYPGVTVKVDNKIE